MSLPLASLIDIPIFGDTRGCLGVAEEGKAVPFAIRRLFYLFDLSPGSVRGEHAHREQHQLIIMMSGECTIIADNGLSRAEHALTSPSRALYSPPMIWLTLRDFSPGAVCAVLTSGCFDESDYIRDHEHFCAHVRRGQTPAEPAQ